jgi:predicted dehydrogenase
VRLREVIEDGSLGPIAMVRMRHGHSQGFDPGFRASWFSDPSQAGGGTFLDDGIDLLDLYLWPSGMLKTVFAISSARATGLPVEDAAVVKLDYITGPSISICVSSAFASADGGIEVCGGQASISLSGVDMASRGLSTRPLMRICERLAGEHANERCWRDLGVEPIFTTGGFHGLGVDDVLSAIQEEHAPSAGLADA